MHLRTVLLATVVLVDLVPVLSTNVAAIGYDPATASLVIRFHNQSRVYRYKGVPQAVHDAFMASPSKGFFFTQHIKGRYSFEQVE